MCYSTYEIDNVAILHVQETYSYYIFIDLKAYFIGMSFPENYIELLSIAKQA